MPGPDAAGPGAQQAASGIDRRFGIILDTLLNKEVQRAFAGEGYDDGKSLPFGQGNRLVELQGMIARIVQQH